MARAIDYDRGYISRVETNQAQPSDDLLGRIADQMGLTTEQLRNLPLQELAPNRFVYAFNDAGGLMDDDTTVPPASKPARPRTIGKRIDRIIAMAHLDDEEKVIVEDHLARLTSEVLSFYKASKTS